MAAEATPATPSRLRLGVGVLLVGHGLIHALGPLDIWGITDIEALTGEPTIDFGPSATDVLAGVWLLALALFVAAGLAVLMRRGWWRPVAVVGVLVSQFVVILWWNDAAAGTIPNLLIVGAILYAPRMQLRFNT
ncbi:hypothetical protein BMS3Bbin02_01970 [bacterium BMS3Bbin02]|nr:hypothetical protein BMS3Bbin02_01970 [bacterium BMS3Bbin02]